MHDGQHQWLIDAPPGTAAQLSGSLTHVLLCSAELERASGLFEVLAAHPGCELFTADIRAARIAELLQQLYNQALVIDVLQPGQPIDCGQTTLQTAPVTHAIGPRLGVRLQTPDATIVRLPDGRADGEVRRLVRGADLIILDPNVSPSSALLEWACLLYTSPSPRDATLSRMPSSA